MNLVRLAGPGAEELNRARARQGYGVLPKP